MERSAFVVRTMPVPLATLQCLEGWVDANPRSDVSSAMTIALRFAHQHLHPSDPDRVSVVCAPVNPQMFTMWSGVPLIEGEPLNFDDLRCSGDHTVVTLRLPEFVAVNYFDCLVREWLELSVTALAGFIFQLLIAGVLGTREPDGTVTPSTFTVI